jgi:hypothetical protein
MIPLLLLLSVLLTSVLPVVLAIKTQPKSKT